MESAPVLPFWREAFFLGFSGARLLFFKKTMCFFVGGLRSACCGFSFIRFVPHGRALDASSTVESKWFHAKPCIPC
jgi:hypothetical protein